MGINPIAYLQAEVAQAYMHHHNLDPSAFIELDHKYGILHFIEVGYEPFHLTGTQGIIEEIDDYIRIQKNN
jgi:hypothetical protein